MSLINDMLRDLERRDRGAPAQAAGPPPAAPVAEPRGGRRLRRWLMACLILVVVAALAYGGWAYWRAEPVLYEFLTASDPTQRDAASSADTPTDNGGEGRPEDGSVAQSGQAAPVEPARVTGVALERDGDTVALRVNTSRPVLHNLEGEGEAVNRLRLTVPAQADAISVPDLLGAVEATAAVDWRLGEERLALDWRLSAPATVRVDGQALAPGIGIMLEFDASAANSEPSETVDEEADAGSESSTDTANASQPADDSDREAPGGSDAAPSEQARDVPEPESALPRDPVAAPAADAAADAAPSIKQPSGASAGRETAARARAAREDGHWAEAASLYREALDSDPEAWRLRRELANVEQQRGDRQAAIAVLDAGLEQGVHTSALARAKARVLMADALAEAIDVLEAHPPQGFGAGRWHALLASLYREQGRAPDAAALYREMVREQPQNGVWWLGLGVSLEETGDRDRALAAYQRALRVGELDGDLMAFLRRRVERLE